MMIYKKGSTGYVVKQIQKALAGAGLKVIPDGVYGAITEEAVRDFQRANSLTADGIVGPTTLTLLIPERLKKSKRIINEIIVHCTATPEGKDYTVEDIRKMHRQQGWSDIGYHYLIGRHGERWAGRDVDIIGAHCCGHNAHSIGVCYVGGMSRMFDKDKDTRTLAQKATLIQLLTELKQLYPKAVILGHRDTSPDLNGNGIVEPAEWVKKCPCFDAKTEYKYIGLV